MPTWRVLTWNLRGAAGPDLRQVAATITDRHPDVVALQEVQRRQARRLARTMGWHACWARKHYPLTPLLWWRAEGLAILSPLPPEAVQRTTLSPGVGTWTYRHRILLSATVHHPRRGGGPGAVVRVHDVHLASHDRDERLAQAQRVVERALADAADGAPTVIAGDLNEPGDDASEIEVLRTLRAAGVRDSGGPVTNPAAQPHQRLDYVLLPEGAEVRERLVPAGGAQWARLSDHLPVLVEADLPP